jgi:NADH:ubiquinone oxidoreductase subunit F (NADH-binding)
MTRALHLASALRDDTAGEADPRLLPAGPHRYQNGEPDPDLDLGLMQDLASHVERFGRRPAMTGAAAAILLGVLEEVGLAGHGGGHFPVARKWRTALRSGGGGIVVANGAESEPASAKDRTLLATVPHLVLDGLMCAAEVVGAEEAVLWMHDDAHDASRAVSTAIAERRAQGLPEISVRKVLTPASYLSGESSAILRALSGGPTLPAFGVQPAAVAGYRGRPALVHNVETLARIGLLARTGLRGHRPTALVTVNIHDARAVLELNPQSTIGDAIRAGGWTGKPPQAVLVGGYGGSWLPWSVAAVTPLRHRELTAVGAGLGAGVLMPLGETECGISRTAAIAGFLATAGARQCGPCRFGLPALAEGLAALAQGQAHRREVERLRKLTTLVDGRGGCHHPDGAARLIASALKTFEGDADGHARGRACSAAHASLTWVD